MVLLQNLDSIIDIGFVLMVTVTCYLAIFGQRDSSGGKSKQWKDELQTLEGTLRELIGEATAAGSNLNRSLLKRREELQKLIQQIDQAKFEAESQLANGAQVAQSNSRRPQRSGADPVLQSNEELPNSSWARRSEEAPSFTNTNAYQQLREAAAIRPPTTYSMHENDFSERSSQSLSQKAHGQNFDASEQDSEILELDELAELHEDRVTFSQPLQNQVAAAASNPFRKADQSRVRSATSSVQPQNIQHTSKTVQRSSQLSQAAPVLAAKIERINEQRLGKSRQFSNPSVDPTALKIARRLLAMGKELHVVARKVDLPLAEIREIDRVLRSELNLSPLESYTNEAQNNEPQIERSTGLA